MPMRFPSPNWQRLLVFLGLLALIPLLPPSTPAHADSAGAPYMAPISQGSDADFFGIVGRDPWFEWRTDPVHYPNDVNQAALEGMARDLAYAGAAGCGSNCVPTTTSTRPAGPGYLDYRKWDWFIKECAPKYGLKVLLLLGSGLLDHSTVDPSASFSRINDAPTGRMIPTTMRASTPRGRSEVADHFGDSVAGYEILNEPNISDILYQDSNGGAGPNSSPRFSARCWPRYTGRSNRHIPASRSLSAVSSTAHGRMAARRTSTTCGCLSQFATARGV